MDEKKSFCVLRKRKVDKAKTENFLKTSADSGDEDELGQVFDWMDPVPIKRAAIALEDRTSKRKRLKEEGITHAEAGRYWEAIKKWETALSLSQFNQIHCLHRGNVVNRGDEEMGKNERLRERAEFKNSFDSSEERVLDAQLLEMKAQALMELEEVFPAVQAAEAAALSNPVWHVGWRTLGRAQIGFGDIDVAIKSFSKAIHLKPDEEECWKHDLHWAIELKGKRTQKDGIDSCGKCQRPDGDQTSRDDGVA